MFVISIRTGDKLNAEAMRAIICQNHAGNPDAIEIVNEGVSDRVEWGTASRVIEQDDQFIAAVRNGVLRLHLLDAPPRTYVSPVGVAITPYHDEFGGGEEALIPLDNPYPTVRHRLRRVQPGQGQYGDDLSLQLLFERERPVYEQLSSF